ncbi:MAG: 3-hydroxyacyl-CoA dehydrogenase [Planctomycetota bacterium]|nr:MAG: 3-hydroxyacyl-CoA dehydrogenase [Planctomycetota bacterium]
MRGTAALAELATADLVIEAVFEDLAVKREVFAQLGELTPAETILATNTSSFRVAQLAEVTARPQRVLGLHYFYHPAKNRLVEVVPHAGTSPEVTGRAWQLQERIGKTPIRSADTPGFVVNRFFVPWLNEAVRLLEEEVANLPAIEQLAKEIFGIGMGPFELMNVTGVPIALHAARTLGAELGALYAPSARLQAQVTSGQPWPLAGEPRARDPELVRARLLGLVFLVAAELVEQGVASIEDTDIGARVGLRWPLGPFELMNQVGIEEAARLAGALAERYGVELPRLLREQAARGEPFRFERVRLEVENGIATLWLNRPDALNALDEEMLAQLRERFEQAAAQPQVRAIVLRGRGKAFVAGADVRWFVRLLQAGEIDRIVAFTRKGHELLERMRETDKVVIAVLDGLSLGGGSELALGCDRIVATPRGSLGFPETGIGIYPGLGGTQNLPRRVGRGLARYLIYTGRVLTAEEAFALGLIDRLVPHEQLPAAIEELIAAGKTAEHTGPPHPLSGRWAEAARLFDRPAEELLGGAVGTDDPVLARELERVRTQKAPIALRLASELTELALSNPYREGLRAELERLPQVLGTRDALVGLRSVLERSRPAFTGS